MANQKFPTEATLSYVTMTEELLPDILTIENRSYPIAWKEQLFIECIQKKYICQVLKAEDQIIGYFIVQVILDEYHILNLCIAPDFQGNGFGKYQLQHIHQIAESEMMNRVLLEVRVSNAKAKKLYSNYGFQTIGKRKNYYPDLEGREDAQVMELALG